MRFPARFDRITAAYAAVLALAGFLLFFNLDGRLLWGDEAETALLAKNVLIYGVPKSYDGINQISIWGPHLDSNADKIWIWSPWLKEYVTAAGFVLFGHTDWAARCLFALCGWISVGVLAWVAYRIYQSHWVALGAALLLATSEVFLLHARQCRYYSFSVLAEILLVYGVHQMLRENRRGIATVAAALTLLFYSNYLMAAANVPGLLVLAVTLFVRRRRAALMVFASLGLAFLAGLPWVIYANLLAQFKKAGSGLSWLKLWQYLIELNFHFMPWLCLALPVIGALIAWRARRTAAAPAPAPGEQPVTALEAHLLALVALYLVSVTVAPDWFLRYVIALLPVCCLLAAAWVFRHVRWRAVAVACVILQCSTNLFPLIGGYPWRYIHTLHSPILRYVRGTAHEYYDRVRDVVRFFHLEGKPGQSAFSFDPEFALIYYTGLKLTDGRLNGGQFPNPLPDWILGESASGLRGDLRIGLSPEALNLYHTITIDVHNSRRAGSLPEPDSFEYHSVTNKVEYVVYRKKLESNSNSQAPSSK